MLVLQLVAQPLHGAALLARPRQVAVLLVGLADDLEVAAGEEHLGVRAVGHRHHVARIGVDAPDLAVVGAVDRAAGRQLVVGDGVLEGAAAVLQLADLLDRALAEGPGAEHLRPARRLEGAGDDLARARGGPVHEHHDRHVGEDGPRRARPVGGAAAVARLHPDDVAGGEKEVRHLDRGRQAATGVVAEVEDEALEGLVVGHAEGLDHLAGAVGVELGQAEVAEAVLRGEAVVPALARAGEAADGAGDDPSAGDDEVGLAAVGVPHPDRDVRPGRAHEEVDALLRRPALGRRAVDRQHHVAGPHPGLDRGGAGHRGHDGEVPVDHADLGPDARVLAAHRLRELRLVAGRNVLGVRIAERRDESFDRGEEGGLVVDRLHEGVLQDLAGLDQRIEPLVRRRPLGERDREAEEHDPQEQGEQGGGDVAAHGRAPGGRRMGRRGPDVHPIHGSARADPPRRPYPPGFEPPPRAGAAATGPEPAPGPPPDPAPHVPGHP